MATHGQLLDPGIAAAEGAPARGRESDLVGRLFDGKFLIQRLIGVGGFGAVYAARDLQLECGVAIKILHREVASDSSNFDGFLGEVRRLTRLKHPNVVGWKALTQTADGSAYLVMELLEGRELGELLHEEVTLPPMRAARILLQILDALRAAHHLPDGDCLLHLDLKPANVFLEADPSGRGDLDWVKVIDFGISQYLGADAEKPEVQSNASLLTSTEPGRTSRRRTAEDAGITQKRNSAPARGCQACTPDYAAPEQGAHFLPGQAAPALDERADLYAVGVIGFRMVTGKLPFGEVNQPEALLRAKLENDAPPVESFAPKVPRRLARFLDRCLERDREKRFRTAEEAYAALESIVHPRVGRRTIAIGAAVAVLLTLSGWLLQPARPPNRFELFEELESEERLLGEKNSLFLGPAQGARALRLAGVTIAPSDPIRLVADPRPEAATIEGWRADFVSDSKIKVHAELLDARVRQPAFVEVQRSGGERLYSESFDLVWLGKKAIAIGDIDVPNRGTRSVDPAGLELRIPVDAEPDDIEKVEVECGSQWYEARIDHALSHPPHCVYVLPLKSLQLSEHTSELKVHVLDCSGGGGIKPARFEFVSSKLEFVEPPELAGVQRFGARIFVPDLAKARLKFRLTGEADVDLLVFDDDGMQVARQPLSKVASGDVVLASFNLDLGDRGFTGSIEIKADDKAYVLRSEPTRRGTVTEGIKFFCSREPPRIAVDLGAAGGKSHPLTDGQPCYSNSRNVQVHVTRNSPIPARVAVVDRATGGKVEDEEAMLVSPSDNLHVFDVALAGEGEHELSIRGWRYVDEDDRKRAPDVEFVAHIVVVAAAPWLEVAPVEGEEAAQKAGVWPVGARLSIRAPGADDAHSPAVAAATATTTPTPTHLRFELARVNHPTPLVAAGELPGVAHPGDSLPISLPLPAEVSPAVTVPDGRYVLRLLATDEAGNEAVPVELELEVARNGPTFELKRPVTDGLWQPDGKGDYEIRAITEDANGVASMTASLAIDGAAPIEVAMVAENKSADATCSEWTGHTRIPRSWATRQIELRCSARDGRGCSTDFVTRREAGTIDRSPPVCVRVKRGGATLASMRLVKGNHEGDYVFGGRADDTEEKLFKAVGLGTYNRLRFSRSWEATFAKDKIPDYYLDEREVTVGEFLRFLDDARGFADASHWPKGSHRDAARRASLRAQLKTTAADLPVTQVTWDEAAAYAHWCGKRLPSFVEWEYALRGGPQYRACASIRPARRDDASAPAPAGSGGDVTPDTRLWNLTGNVAEWSATPAGSPDEVAAGSPGTFAAARPSWFLEAPRPAELARADSFWVVGASYRHARAEFSIADQRRREWHGPDVGFRCAATLDEVVSVLEVNDPAHATFTEGDE
jgi:serine/threonine protein kinase/formylglycine-generating enzyme required for sulfatase activity